MDLVNASGQWVSLALHFGCGWTSISTSISTRRQALVADLWFVLLTIAGFVILGLMVRAVERL